MNKKTNNEFTAENINEKSNLKNYNVEFNFKKEDNDLKKLFQHITVMKKELLEKFENCSYKESIQLVNKLLPLSKKFYDEENIYIVELVFILSECYINQGLLEEGINYLENLIDMTNKVKHQLPIQNYRNKAFLLIGASSINLGDYSKALKSYESSDKEIMAVYSEPELNLKQSAICLNIGICYIYLSNFTLSEKVLLKGLKLIEGLLGNETIHKLNADFYENLGLINEQKGKCKEAVNLYKKSLKIKFNLYGEKNDEVLELQFKISSAYSAMKLYKEAEEIITPLLDLVSDILNEGVENESYYRYGVYFYNAGVIMIKLTKKDLAVKNLKKAEELWKGLLSDIDPIILSLQSLLKTCIY